MLQLALFLLCLSTVHASDKLDIEASSLKQLYDFHQQTITRLENQLKDQATHVADKVAQIDESKLHTQARRILDSIRDEIVDQKKRINKQLGSAYQAYMGKKASKSTKTAFHIQAQQLSEKMVNTIEDLFSQVNALVAQWQRSQRSEQKQQEVEQAIQGKSLQAKLLRMSRPIISQLFQLHEKTDLATRRYVGQLNINSEYIYKTIDMYQQLAKQIQQVYRSIKVQPDANDRLGIARIVYNRFIDACIKDCAMTQKVLQGTLKQKQNIQIVYYQTLYNFDQRMFGMQEGKEGYTAIEKNMRTMLFADNKQLEHFFAGYVQNLYLYIIDQWLQNALRAGLSWDDKLVFVLSHIPLIITNDESIHVKQRIGKYSLALLKNNITQLFQDAQQSVKSRLSAVEQLLGQWVQVAQFTGLPDEKEQGAMKKQFLKQLISKYRTMTKMSQSAQDQQLSQGLAQELSLLGLIGSEHFLGLDDNETAYVQAAVTKQDQKKNIGKTIIDNYRANISSIGSVKGFQDSYPKYFALQRFIQPVAADVATKQDYTTQELLDLAVYLQISKQCRLHMIDPQLIFNEKNKLKDNIKKNLSSDQYELVQQFLANGQFLRNILDRQLADGKMTLAVEASQMANQAREPQTFVIGNYPVFPVPPVESSPISSLPYPGYPTVLSFLLWIQKLSDPSTETVIYGQKSIASLQNKDIYKRATKDIAHAFLSAAFQTNQRVNFIMNHDKVLDKQDFYFYINQQEADLLNKSQEQYRKVKLLKQKDKAELDSYIPAYDVLKSYLDDAQLTYIVAAQEYLPQAKQYFNKQQVQLYEQLGDLAVTFLIGSPQNARYLAGRAGVWSGVLADMMQYYKAAFGLDNSRQTFLLNKTVDQLVQAGDILVNNKNVFASIRYYQIGVGAAVAITPHDWKVVDNVGIKLLKANYKGLLNLLQHVRKGLVEPIVIDYKNGNKKTFTFQEFVNRIVSCPALNVNKYECQVYESYRQDLLDALLYLQETGMWARYLSNPSGMKNEKEVKSKKTEQDELLKSFIKKHDISFNSVDDVIAMFKKEQFINIMQEAFSYVRTLVTSAQRKQGYAFLSAWCDKLFISYAQLYALWFLKGGGPLKNRMADVLQLIKLERTNILAPAEQWV